MYTWLLSSAIHLATTLSKKWNHYTNKTDRKGKQEWIHLSIYWTHSGGAKWHGDGYWTYIWRISDRCALLKKKRGEFFKILQKSNFWWIWDTFRWKMIIKWQDSLANSAAILPFASWGGYIGMSAKARIFFIKKVPSDEIFKRNDNLKTLWQEREVV